MTERMVLMAFGAVLALTVAFFAVSAIHAAFARASAQVECIRDPAACSKR